MLTPVRQAWQSWKGAPGIAALAILAFAVGVGSTTATYTVVNAVLLGQLPYADGNRFVVLYSAQTTDPDSRGSSTASDLAEFQRRTTSFDLFGWFRNAEGNLTSPGEPQHLWVASVTPDLAQGIGVPPRMGRWLTSEGEAVLSQKLWRQLGARNDLVGESIALDGHALTVVGVMPPGFQLPVIGIGTPLETDVWTFLNPNAVANDSGLYFAYARRHPGVSLTEARADVARTAAEIAALTPASHEFYTARLDDLYESTIIEVRPTLLILSGAAALLLLIACANVAGLLLTRSVSRARETATRIALGASERQLAVQYFIEGLFVAFAGAVVGMLLSVGLVRAVVAVAADYLPLADTIGIDWTVPVFAIGAALLACTASSLAPLWHAFHTPAYSVLGSGARTSAGRHTRRVSQGLVVAEVALAFTLLGSGAVLLAHLANLNGTSAGFDIRNLLTFQVTLSPGTEETRSLQQRRLLEVLQAEPGITDVALASGLPLDGCCLGGAVYPEGQTLGATAVERTSFLFVTPSYARTMRIGIRRGQFLDSAPSNPVKIAINEAAARRFWPDRDPVGLFGRLGSPDGDRFQVSGVIDDSKNDGFAHSAVAELYLPAALAPAAWPSVIVVRSALPTETLVPAIRRAVTKFDAFLPIYDVRTMEAIAGESLTLERVRSMMTLFFALSALLMATLGVFGVVSYGVRQRRVEIGTRMALGAVSRDLVALVLGDGLRMAVYGLAIGGVAIVGAVLILQRWLEVGAVGLAPYAASSFTVLAVAALASSVPAWRATMISPMIAIRDEDPSVWHMARARIRHAVRELTAQWSGEPVEDPSVLADLIAAVRHATSADDALGAALSSLRDRLDATSVALLEPSGTGAYRLTTAIPAEAGSGSVLPRDGLLMERLRHHAGPLPFSRGDLDAMIRWASEQRPDRVEEARTLRALNVRLAVPMHHRDEIVGVVVIGPPAGREAFSSTDLRLVRAFSDQLVMLIENTRLAHRLIEQEALRRDLRLAATIQKRLLPEHPPSRPTLDLAAISVPARTVGGDYYDFVEFGDGRLGIAVADVSGKGVAAALIMSVVQASLRSIAAEDNVTPDGLAGRMNRFLHRSADSASYATFFYAEIDESARRLRYVNCGHNPPYVVRARHEDGGPLTVEELSAGGSVIGLFPDTPYEQSAIELESGDVLVAFTDGVTEAQGSSQEEFGEERLKALLTSHAHLPAAEIADVTRQALQEWIGGAAQYDDLTCVVMKVR